MTKKPNGQSLLTRAELKEEINVLSDKVDASVKTLSDKIKSNTESVEKISHRVLRLEGETHGMDEAILNKRDGQEIMNKLDSIVQWMETAGR